MLLIWSWILILLGEIKSPAAARREACNNTKNFWYQFYSISMADLSIRNKFDMTSSYHQFHHLRPKLLGWKLKKLPHDHCLFWNAICCLLHLRYMEVINSCQFIWEKSFIPNCHLQMIHALIASSSFICLSCQHIIIV